MGLTHPYQLLNKIKKVFKIHFINNVGTLILSIIFILSHQLVQNIYLRQYKLKNNALATSGIDVNVFSTIKPLISNLSYPLNAE